MSEDKKTEFQVPAEAESEFARKADVIHMMVGEDVRNLVIYALRAAYCDGYVSGIEKHHKIFEEEVKAAFGNGPIMRWFS